MTRPVRHPATCGDCREFHDPPLINTAGKRFTCSPRGTRWHLLRKATDKACRTVHAIMAEDEDGQDAML